MTRAIIHGENGTFRTIGQARHAHRRKVRIGFIRPRRVSFGRERLLHDAGRIRRIEVSSLTHDADAAIPVRIIDELELSCV